MEGIVEKVSEKQRGVKIDGRWYDWAAGNTLPEVGHYIEFSAEGKRITYAAHARQPTAQPPAQSPRPTASTASGKYEMTPNELNELRVMVRENVLALAVELELGGKLDGMLKEDDTTIATMRERILHTAEVLEAWVMG